MGTLLERTQPVPFLYSGSLIAFFQHSIAEQLLSADMMVSLVVEYGARRGWTLKLQTATFLEQRFHIFQRP